MTTLDSGAAAAATLAERGDETSDGRAVIEDGDSAKVIEAVEARFTRQDPDVLVISEAALVPAVGVHDDIAARQRRFRKALMGNP